MRRTANATVIACAALANFILASTASDRPTIAWQHDYDRSLAEAKNLDRPVLLYFTAKWCPSCLRVERTVFADKRVNQVIREKVVAIRIDSDNEPELVELFRIDRIPTAIILSHDARILKRIEGYLPADQYVAELEGAITTSARQDSVANRRTTVPHTAIPEPAAELKHAIEVFSDPTPDPSVQWANREVRPSAVLDRIESLPAADTEDTPATQENLAAEGACVVTIFEQHKIVPGDPTFSVQINGRTYHCAGRRQLEKLSADPATYTPAFHGACCTSLFEKGTQIEGTVRSLALYRNRLLLFAGPEQRKQFLANPKFYFEYAASRLDP